MTWYGGLADCQLIQFVVDARTKTLRLLAELKTDRGVVHAEGVFEGVDAYVLDGDALGTILSEVEEVDALDLWSLHRDRMRATHAKNGGHAPWVLEENTARERFVANRTRGFRITSAIGLTGAVWSAGFETRTVEA